MKQFETKNQLFFDFKNARQINDENLKKILADNGGTRYGREKDFSHIQTYEQYCQRVPLTEYADYGDRLCEQNEFTVYPVLHFLMTSGTTGSQKKFLFTEEAAKRYYSYIYDMPYCLTEARGESLHTSVFGSVDKKETLLSHAYFTWLEKNGHFHCEDFVGGRELLFSDGIAETAYVKAWLLAASPELVSIQSIFLYEVLLVFRYLEENWKMILSDMREGRISVGLSEGIKENLLLCRPDEEWLDTLEDIFLQGFSEPIVPRIWKKLQFISGIGGRMYEFQKRALGKYSGETPVYYFAYASSECMAGVALSMNKAEYALLPQSAFYEFFSVEEERVLDLSSVEIGKRYELIITTFTGLYRYRTGDMIEVVSFEGETPVFEVIGRRNYVLDVAGEKVDVATMNATVTQLEEKMGIDFSDFAVGIDTEHTPSRYFLFVEVAEPMEKENAAEEFDACLKKLSLDYEDIRRLRMLDRPKIYTVSKGDISGVNQLSVKKAHNKPRIFLTEEQTEWLLARSKEHEK